MENTPIREYLSSLPRSLELVYFANPGNAGDSLIALATYQLFKELDIRYCIVNKSKTFDPTGRIMVYSGGGNLVQYYDTARKVIQETYPRLARLVILPHTIQANEDLLASFRDNVDVICREPASYVHVKKNASRANVYLMDDMAFHLDAAGLMEDDSFVQDQVPYSWKLRDDLYEAFLPLRLALGRRLSPGQPGSLNTFRKDLESSGRFPHREYVDLATLFAHGTGSEAVARYVTRRLLKVLNRYQVIRTDRLHICIAAALLGKQVDFFANSSSKCEDVYRYSMKDRFPNVRWMG
jgi:exopolysaccharide biosynthesis predicted pyruvyltransferase EpsI